MSIFISSKVAVTFKLRDAQGKVIKRRSIPQMYVGDVEDWIQDLPYFNDLCRAGDITFVRRDPMVQIPTGSSEKEKPAAKKKAK